jgi:hypothetical protein
LKNFPNYGLDPDPKLSQSRIQNTDLKSHPLR